MNHQEAKALAEAIAAAVDSVLRMVKDTAILEVRHGQAAPHLAVVITANAQLIPEIVSWTKEKEHARPRHTTITHPVILRRCQFCGEWPAECRCANPDAWKDPQP